MIAGYDFFDLSDGVPESERGVSWGLFLDTTLTTRFLNWATLFREDLMIACAI